MRRGRIIVLAILVSAVAAAVLAVKLHAPTGARCVLLVTLDTFRADRLGVQKSGPRAGQPSLTPNLDRFAAKGVLFEDAWTSAPLTVPAHATIMTGRYPPQHGVRTNAAGSRLPRRADRAFVTLAEALRTAGCRTGAFISASCLRGDATGLDAGFDTYDQVDAAVPGTVTERERAGDITVDAALRWITAGKEASKAPFFAWVHLWDPHYPYNAPGPFGAGLANQGNAKGYDGEIAYVDHCVGRLLDGVAALGYDDVVIVIVGDHGEGLGEHEEPSHGFLLHEATLHVPLILSATGMGLKPARISGAVPIRDIPATLLSLANVSVPEGMSEQTLLAPPPAAGRAIYAESLYGNDAFQWAQLFAFRQGNLKVIDCGEELLAFDLAADPAELNPKRYDPTTVGDDPAAAAIALAVEALHVGAAGAISLVDDPNAAIQGSSYFGGGGGAAPFDAQANRLRPNPYTRMWELTELMRAQAILGVRPLESLALLDDLATRAPKNPQVTLWRARALEPLHRYREALDGYITTYALGSRDPEVIRKALQMGFLAATKEGRPDAVEPTLDLADRAAAAGVSRTDLNFLFAARIRIATGQKGQGAKALLDLAEARSRTTNAAVLQFIAAAETDARALAGTSPPR